MSGYTPLMLAIEHSRAEAAEFLISCGADPMAASRLSLTPVAIADWYGYKKIADLVDHAATERFGPSVGVRFSNLNLGSGSGSGIVGAMPSTVALLAQLPR